MSFVVADTRIRARLKEEWAKLVHYNPQLAEVIHDLGGIVHEKTKGSLVVTAIYRSQVENNEIYKSHPEKPKKTAHSVWSAVDVRSRGIEEYIDELVKYINEKYDSKNANKCRNGHTALFHEVAGHGPHFHIQFAEKHPKNIHSKDAGKHHE